MAKTTVEIVTIGTELLVGQISDTNARHLGRALPELGLSLERITTVGDDLGGIVRALEEALARANVVLTTGGLGPTEDDLTRQAVARATRRPLVFSSELMAQIEAYFAARGRTMSPNNRRQAEIPESAIPIPNPVGTAPAFAVEHMGSFIASMPGVPHEMEYLFAHAVRPLLVARYPSAEAIAVRVLHTAAIGEGVLDLRIADLEQGTNPVIGTLAHFGRVDLRLVARAATREAATAINAGVEREIRARVGAYIYGADGETHEGAFARELARRGWRLALYETATGGALAARLALDPGGRAVLARAEVRPHGGPGTTMDDGQPGAEAAARALAAEGTVALALVGRGELDQATWAAARWPGGEAAIELPRGCGREPARTYACAVALELVRTRLGTSG